MVKTSVMVILVGKASDMCTGVAETMIPLDNISFEYFGLAFQFTNLIYCHHIDFLYYCSTEIFF